MIFIGLLSVENFGTAICKCDIWESVIARGLKLCQLIDEDESIICCKFEEIYHAL